jgi:hypothetical protein
MIRMSRTAESGPAVACPSPARAVDGYDTPVPRLSVVVSTREEVGNVDEADLLSTTITVHGLPVQPLAAWVGLTTAVDGRGAGPRPAPLRGGGDARRETAPAPRRHGDGHGRHRQLRHGGPGAGGRAAGGDRGRFAVARLPAGRRSGLHGALGRGTGPLAAPGPGAHLASRLPACPAAHGPAAPELDSWVLRTAAREAAGWPEHRGRKPAIAINLVGRLPEEADFLTMASDTVAETGLAWDRLVLELVETSLVALPPHALAPMAELVERGLRFAVDDFGTGVLLPGHDQGVPGPDGHGRPGVRHCCAASEWTPTGSLSAAEPGGN